MSLSAVPYALQNGSHSADLFRQATSSLVPPGGGLVTFGDLNVTQTGTPSMNILVGVGRAWVPGTNLANVTGGNFSNQAMYYAQNDAATTVTVAASDPTNPRIDVVYLAIQDSQYAGSTNTAVLGVATGVPTAGATYPTNAPGIPSNAIALAWINVAANASNIVNANITNTATPFNVRYVELTGSTSPTANVSWGPGPLAVDTANSKNYSWCTIPANDKVTLTPGNYMVFIRYSLSANASGTSWGAIVNDANTFTYTSTDFASGNSTIAVQTPLMIQSTQNVRFTFYTGTAGATLTSRIRIVKVS